MQLWVGIVGISGSVQYRTPPTLHDLIEEIEKGRCESPQLIDCPFM
jgi:hypothetical protein